MNIYKYLLDAISNKGGAYLILIDPDKIVEEKLPLFIRKCEQAGVDGFLIGGSLMVNSKFDEFIEKIKIATNLPAIIFPGGVNQISNIADAILYLSVVSGRNSEHLIGKHVLAAPIIKAKNIEPISNVQRVFPVFISKAVKLLSYVGKKTFPPAQIGLP